MKKGANKTPDQPQERRAHGADRSASQPDQSDEIRKNILERINGIVEGLRPEDDGTISRDAALLPGLLTPRLARAIRNIRNQLAPYGFLLTFHTAADGEIPDEAGRTYSAPEKIGEKTPRPIPPESIKHARIRTLPYSVNRPIPPDYERYLDKLEKGKLGFGDLETGVINADAMVMQVHQEGEEWSEVMVLPLMELSIHPNMQALHYGGAGFEGMSAEASPDGSVNVFGIEQHWKRICRTARSFGCTPPSREAFETAIIKAVQQNSRFIPPFGKGRLYIRPHIFDGGPKMRVGNSKTTVFMVEVTPIGSADSYFGQPEIDEKGNVKGKIFVVPTTQVRSAEGLPGNSKMAGNYAPTAVSIRVAKELNAGKNDTERGRNLPAGILYLDRVIEGQTESEQVSAEFRETNASNIIFFRRDGEQWTLVTPSNKHNDILGGRTLNLILDLAQEWGWKVEQRAITLEEVKQGVYSAAGACGTAALFSPVDGIRLARIAPNTESGEWEGKLQGENIMIRDAEAINREPIPEPVQKLLDAVMAVKSGRDPQHMHLLTPVPGVVVESKIEDDHRG